MLICCSTAVRAWRHVCAWAVDWGWLRGGCGRAMHLLPVLPSVLAMAKLGQGRRRPHQGSRLKVCICDDYIAVLYTAGMCMLAIADSNRQPIRRTMVISCLSVCALVCCHHHRRERIAKHPICGSNIHCHPPRLHVQCHALSVYVCDCRPGCPPSQAPCCASVNRHIRRECTRRQRFSGLKPSRR
jgi:hypothetical protein